ncbi:Developmental and secondary metabolism regulator [Alternaria gaisen]|uniref:Developmental and secondary metabolism regulator n=1 Tax=Alternaria gaisen TaxID=167740 RepID=A0ACB6FKT0_9PLEO|nr:Developmental and secondary metabolism regulator [Alternaria gaisen]
MFRFPPGARFEAYESWRCLSAIFWWMAYAVHAEREGVERSLVQGPEQHHQPSTAAAQKTARLLAPPSWKLLFRRTCRFAHYFDSALASLLIACIPVPIVWLPTDAASMMNTIAVSNETKSQFIRTTKDGRQIRYNLQVIQQPERARACGSGAKSSADRRPVDPPPIVELRVFENDQEITFAYNANFFLHASLENARPIAAGRSQSSAGPSFPVLTGTPVAGMAYLERPTPAGYFIFPDLSVRHEGKYRLSFALFENLAEVKDLDPGDPDVIYDGNHFVTHRAEVKSAPFTVFSAKKFPGLSESTALSRQVAEQGCRVRIRRDVRMRRRENKSSKEWDEYDEEGGGYDRARGTATPDNYHPPSSAPLDDRPRSVSNASNHSLVPPRRPSMEEMAHGYPASNSYQQQMPPPQNPTYTQMPSYASSQQHQYSQQYSAPQTAPMMQSPQHSTAYSQHAQHPQHPQHSSYSSQHQPQPPMPVSQQYGYPNYQQQAHYEQVPPARQEQVAPEYAHPVEYRRPSVTQPSTQQYSAPSHSMQSYGSMDQYNRPQQMSQPLQPLQPLHTSPQAYASSTPSAVHTPSHQALPSLRPIVADKLEPVSPSYQSPPGTLSATMSVNSDGSAQNYALPKFNPQAQGLPPMSAGSSNKRSFSSTFDSRHLNERMVAGSRPQPTGAGYTYDTADSPDMEEPMDRAAMSYRRADGTQRQRHVPAVGH